MTTTANQSKSPLDYRLLSKKDAAQLLGTTTRTLDRMIADKKIPFLRIPTGIGDMRRTVFDTRDIEKWLEGMRVVPEDMPPVSEDRPRISSARQEALKIMSGR